MASDLVNYVSFVDPAARQPRIGHLDLDHNTIQPLSFKSGTPIVDLYQVIEFGDVNIAAAGEPIAASSVKILPAIAGRDVLAVGKNYAKHAKEFNQSGFDSSDKVDQPSHPVIFTKRATSIVAHGDDICLHPEFTKTLDYEGEIGVIIGKPAFRVSEEDALDYVWGYTIINDVTARERQRDHKQFFIGKSADTFCPIGPIAKPAKSLPKILRVQTVVNGESRQDATTEDLIFSIPFLIKTLSEGLTLQPGDVIATGTPEGVGIGKTPPVFLKAGDDIEISVTGLGTLRSKVVAGPVSPVSPKSTISLSNFAKSANGVGLTTINDKPLLYKHSGVKGGSPIVFVHGLGGTSDYWTPLITTLSLEESHSLHVFDLEGHGLSPTSPLSVLTIESFASDLFGVFKHAGITSGATLVAHSMGCLVALSFVLSNPGLVKKLVLLGPPPSPLPPAGVEASHARSDLARTKGVAAVVDAVASAGTSKHTKKKNPLALTAVRLSLLGQDPEGYAKACSALAGATKALDVSRIGTETLIVTGDEDKVSPPGLCKEFGERIPKARDVVVLDNVGHWHVFEDVAGVSTAVERFL